MRPLLRFIAMFCLLAGGTDSLIAQTSASGGVASRRATPQASGLRLGATLRTKTAGSASEGVISQMRGDSIWLSSSTERIGLSLQSLDSAWTLERSTGLGAAIGAATGGVLLGAFTGLMVNGLCDAATCPTSEAVGGAVIGGLVGAVGGILVGGGAGSLIKRWKQRLPM
jgi:hypothetical protein